MESAVILVGLRLLLQPASKRLLCLRCSVFSIWLSSLPDKRWRFEVKMQLKAGKVFKLHRKLLEIADNYRRRSVCVKNGAPNTWLSTLPLSNLKPPKVGRQADRHASPTVRCWIQNILQMFRCKVKRNKIFLGVIFSQFASQANVNAKKPKWSSWGQWISPQLISLYWPDI